MSTVERFTRAHRRSNFRGKDAADHPGNPTKLLCRLCRFAGCADPANSLATEFCFLAPPHRAVARAEGDRRQREVCAGPLLDSPPKKARTVRVSS